MFRKMLFNKFFTNPIVQRLGPSSVILGLAVLKQKQEYEQKCDQQQTKNQLPLHYEKMKNMRAEWDKLAISNNLNRNDGSQALERSKHILDQAKQIKSLYTDTHYVFIHGQNINFLPIMYFINGIAEKEGKPKYKSYKYLRKPNFKLSWFNSCSIFSVKEGLIEDSSISNIMMCADAYFNSNGHFESASFFFSKNKSIASSEKVIRSILEKDFSYEIRDKEEAAKKLDQICSSLNNEPCGNLVVICIPKKLFWEKNIGYRSHPFGRACYHHPDKSNISILEKLQRDDFFGVDCEVDFREEVYAPPQYRLLVPMLDPKDKILTYVLNPLSKSKRKEIKKQVSELIESSYVSHKSDKDKLGDEIDRCGLFLSR